MSPPPNRNVIAVQDLKGIHIWNFFRCFPLEPKSWRRPCILYSIYIVYLCCHLCPPKFLYVADKGLYLYWGLLICCSFVIDNNTINKSILNLYYKKFCFISLIIYLRAPPVLGVAPPVIKSWLRPWLNLAKYSIKNIKMIADKLLI